MRLTKTIGFTGLSGSGKSYAATWFKLRTGGEIWSFAAEIKSIAKAIGWNGEKDARGRKLLQDLGSIGREYDRQCWVDLMPTDRPLCIDDVRYINEAAAIRGAGGIIVRIVRPGLTPMDHSSETEQRHIIADYTVTNDEAFEEELQAVYDCEMGPLSLK
jgi:hypothetical protein